jgi:RNA-directed DNA polymerase
VAKAGGGGKLVCMINSKFRYSYHEIVSLDNLLEAWTEFLSGKKSRKDVQVFEKDLMSNIIKLHKELITKTYVHSPYHAFNISDPKPRNIHKADVRDRLLHHAIYRVLYPCFDKKFIHDSYSCRLNKGTHKAMNRFRCMAYKESRNHTRTLWVLKCDIRKFFASIDHKTLMEVLDRPILDKDTCWLLNQIVISFNSDKDEVGLPLGNLTSQLLVNIYMNEFDQFVKRELKVKYYIRYADDFVFLSSEKELLIGLLPKINEFLKNHLKLELHPKKVFIKSFASGVDFLGWVHFPGHRVLRTVTKRRVIKGVRLNVDNTKTLQSYLGFLKHGNANKLKKQLSSLE